MNRIKVSLFFIIVLLLIVGRANSNSIAYQGYPPPQVTPTPSVNPFPNNKVYLPFVKTSCSSTQLGYAFAWGNYNGNVTDFPDCGFIYQWSARKMNNTYGLTQIPYIQCQPYKHKSWPNNDIFDMAVNFGRNYSGYLMFLNEPNFTECKTSPKQAKKFLSELSVTFPKAKFVGPHVTHWGTTWLKQFVNLYPYGKPPNNLVALGLHSYSLDGFDAQPELRVNQTVSLLNNRGWYGVDIWITEFSTDNVNMLDDYERAYLDNPRVKKIAWFAPIIPENQPGIDSWPFPESSLFDENTGQLTVFGCWFLQRNC